MLEIRDLHAEIDGKPILKGLSLTIKAGEVHAIMGPNGAGKSTLSYVIAGRDDYEVTAGDILLDGESVLEMEPEDRARAGLFLAFQYPIEIPGVTTSTFLRESVNAHRKALGEEPLEPMAFVKTMRKAATDLGIDGEKLKRAVNVGFSGGEKKRNEILQMALLQPKMAVMDETDSGLDIDALKIVSEGVNKLRAEDRSFLLITHYQRLLDYVQPDFVHIMADGRIVKSGDKTLAEQLEAEGYAGVVPDAA